MELGLTWDMSPHDVVGASHHQISTLGLVTRKLVKEGNCHQHRIQIHHPSCCDRVATT